MNKAQLVEQMAIKTNQTKKITEETLNALIETITETLANGEKIQLVGFGSFEVVTRAARKGKNPQTGEEMKIPACKAPKFKAGGTLKDIVNKK